MSSRFIRIAVALLAFGSVQSAVADDIFTKMAQDFKARNGWPEPFVHADRRAVYDPFATMVCNGWQRENAINDGHFESGGHQLTEAGRIKILWVLNEVPEQHRIVYVRRAATPQETAARIETVQRFVAQSAYMGQAAPVLETTRPEDAWSADQVDMIERKVQKSMPDPKLPPASDSGSGGGGGGSK